MIRHSEDMYLQSVVLGTSSRAGARLGLAVGTDVEHYHYAEIRMSLE